jgi:hypothetical protein
MKDSLTPGTIILKDSVQLPKGVKMETEPCASGWKVLTNMDAYGLDRAICQAGWNFFSLAHTLQVSLIGGQGSSLMKRAINRLVARVNDGKFNALEITDVSAKSFLGIPYAKISARSRHVQQSIFLVPKSAVPPPVKEPGTHITPAPAFL